jgi:hypothetical protein
MRILERLRNHSPHAELGAPGSAEASSADEQQLPIGRYDQLDDKQLIPQLSRLSQVELAAGRHCRSCGEGAANSTGRGWAGQEIGPKTLIFGPIPDGPLVTASGRPTRARRCG